MANREGVTAGQTQAETDTTWMRFCFTVDEDAPFTRENVQQFLLDRGVATRMVWTGNILRQPDSPTSPTDNPMKAYPTVIGYGPCPITPDSSSPQRRSHRIHM
ncbi:MAG: hypothetical protein CM15mP49_38640 [Actinomycetota bacterium]|nr:MAG: hypothetical protein CM15mP49_38640 [Actinomycetota bacterium]